MGMTCRLRELQPGDLEILSGPQEKACELFSRDATAEGVLSLEKSWDGLHYLLTGSSKRGSDPLNFIKHGGRTVGRTIGYDRPRLFDNDFVLRLDAALQTITDEELWGRFDSESFTTENVYPPIWDEPEEELQDEYLHYFDLLKGFVSRLANSGGQMLIVVL